MNIALIVAMAENNAIGINNKIPWHVPGELRYFKTVTMGKPIIMGKKTFLSLSKPLPGRVNIVITRDATWHHDGVTVVYSLKDAIECARDIACINDINEVMIIGGAQIYEQALPLADKIYMTRIYKNFEADTFFPSINDNEWTEIFREEHETEGCEKLKYAYTILQKKTYN